MAAPPTAGYAYGGTGAASTSGARHAGVRGRRLPATASAGQLARLLRLYPFTVLGSALFVAAIYLLGSAFATGSPHEFLLSITAFVLLLGLAGLGRLQAYRFKLVEFEWDTAAVLAARERGTQHRLRTRAARSWLFYRIHFRVLWRLQAGRRATLYGYREVAAPGGELPVPLWFPTSGRLRLTGRLTVRDVFGLTRAQIRPPERRELIVRPGLLGERAAPRVDVSISHDTTQRSQTADQEQYFMREYMPGDRLKDINWKASSRLDELITRISPITQEPTQQLHLVLRRACARPARSQQARGGGRHSGSYRHGGGQHDRADRGRTVAETPTAVLHLDFAKSWLLTFLRVIKQQHPQYTFLVDTGDDSHELESMEEIDSFARHLAQLPLTGEPPAAVPAPARELFIFSTVFDRELPRFVERCGASIINVFRTVPPRSRRRKTAAPAGNGAGSSAGGAGGAAHGAGSGGAHGAARANDAEPFRLCLNESPLPATLGRGWSWTRDRRAAPVGVGGGPRLRLLDEQPVTVSYLCTFSS